MNSSLELLARRAAEAEARCAEAERLAGLGRIAAGLAHEVGNPLCAITNYVHSLEEKVPPELRGTVAAIQRELMRIERMRSGILQRARPHEQDVDLGDAGQSLRETLDFLGEQGVFRRITLELQIDPRPLPVHGVPIELEQTFANLILNAADMMPAGGRLTIRGARLPGQTLVDAGRVRASDPVAFEVPARKVTPDDQVVRWMGAHEAREVVTIVVADSGDGIREGDEERMFEPFVTTKAFGQGTGLGLAIVRRLVDAMRGIVYVQPSREGGAAFHLALPVRDAN